MLAKIIYIFYKYLLFIQKASEIYPVTILHSIYLLLLLSNNHLHYNLNYLIHAHIHELLSNSYFLINI